MKKGRITFEYFEKGQHVSAPNGIAIVCKDEKEIKNETELFCSEIKIKYKVPYEGIKYAWITREYLIRITKEEYENAKQ